MEPASVADLALDIWNELDPEWRQSLRQWLADQVPHGKVVVLPEGQVHLPAAEHFFEATTLYFSSVARAPSPAKSSKIDEPATYIAESRAEAELLAAISEAGGIVEAAASEAAGTDRLRDDLIKLLYSWLVRGLPTAAAASSQD
jgi:hypothetical protein